jgi:hypothetical protein
VLQRFVFVAAAFQHVRENIEDLNGRVGANDTDLIFLKGLMDSPIMRSLVKVRDPFFALSMASSIHVLHFSLIYFHHCFLI